MPRLTLSLTTRPSPPAWGVQTYPDLWDQQSEAWIDAWVAGHSANGIALGKPVIVKEQGAQPTKQRTKLYSTMYTTDFAQIAADKSAVGGLKVRDSIGREG